MKWMSFVLSGAFCGLAGALNAIHLGIVSIETLFYTTSGTVVMMTLLGGMGTFFGPFVGAALFLALEDISSNWTTHWQLVAGLIFIACVRFFPKGVWGSALARTVR
jgi:branched-chain amino acid transport system permease protein